MTYAYLRYYKHRYFFSCTWLIKTATAKVIFGDMNYQKMNSPCLRTFASGERVFFKFKATSFKSRPAILKKLRETTNLGVQRTDKTICKRKYWTTVFTSRENSCVFKSSRNAPLHLRMSHGPRVRSQFTLKNIQGGNWTNQKNWKSNQTEPNERIIEE